MKKGLQEDAQLLLTISYAISFAGYYIIQTQLYHIFLILQLTSPCKTITHYKQFWSAFEKNANNEISKEEYVRVNVKIAKSLLPNFNRDEAAKIAEV